MSKKKKKPVDKDTHAALILMIIRAIEDAYHKDEQKRAKKIKKTFKGKR